MEPFWKIDPTWGIKITAFAYTANNAPYDSFVVITSNRPADEIGRRIKELVRRTDPTFDSRLSLLELLGD